MGRHRPGTLESSTTKYEYSLSHEDESEILSFHYHPGEQAFNEPHLHLRSGAGQLGPELQRAHIPTARLAVEDFIQFLIREYKVEAAQDYRRNLEQSKGRFVKYKRW
ncbi:MAG: hypothetical protein M0R74_00090 [Dehalococcoidia bacterium]|nr:hypothetical protein [Dehalococcoidia bacterium]